MQLEKLCRTDERTDGRSQAVHRPAFTFGEAGKNNAELTGMKINNAKTKLMEVARTPNLVGDVDFGESQLEAVSTFKYLGSTITSSNLIQEEVGVRIAAGTRCL